MGIPQESVLGPLSFVIYIFDLPQGLRHDVKLIADETSLFSVDDGIDESASKLTNNLIRMQESAYQWKMTFNPGRIKPAQEVIFSGYILISTLTTYQLLNSISKTLN